VPRRRRDRHVEQTFCFLHEDVEQLDEPGSAVLASRNRSASVARISLSVRPARRSLRTTVTFCTASGASSAGLPRRSCAPRRSAARARAATSRLKPVEIEPIEDRFVDRPALPPRPAHSSGHRGPARRAPESSRRRRADLPIAPQVLRLRRSDDGRPHQVVDARRDRRGRSESGRRRCGDDRGIPFPRRSLIVLRIVAGDRRAGGASRSSGSPPARRLHVRLNHGLEHLALAVGKGGGHCWASVCMVSSLTKESNLTILPVCI